MEDWLPRNSSYAWLHVSLSPSLFVFSSYNEENVLSLCYYKVYALFESIIGEGFTEKR